MQTQKQNPIIEHPLQLELKPGVQCDFKTLTICSERIRLVPATAEFGDDLFREFTPEITRYMMPKPCERREELDAILAIFAEQRAKGLELIFAVTNKASGEFIGCCGLHIRGEAEAPHLGLWIKKSAHGNKYGREAISTLVQWASENLVVEGFIYPVDRNNIASRRIPESLGGTIIDETKVENMSGNILDEVIYLIPRR